MEVYYQDYFDDEVANFKSIADRFGFLPLGGSDYHGLGGPKQRDPGDIPLPRGPVDALFELGIIYATGREVNTNLIVSHKFFNLAAMRGNDEAKRYRMEISREMDKRQIAEAQRLAREWIRKH